VSDRNPVRGAFRQFQYPTAPLTVGADHTNKMLRAALDGAFSIDSSQDRS
jgi:hypothetical protein